VLVSRSSEEFIDYYKMLRRLLAGSDHSASSDDNNSSSSHRRDNDSICARFCQLPYYLTGDHPDQFVSEPGTGVARLPTGATGRRGSSRRGRSRSGSGNERSSSNRGAGSDQTSSAGGSSSSRPDGALSPLRRREKEESTNLAKFLALGKTLTAADAEEEAKILEGVEGIGEECGICSLKVATHYALPCRHRACKVCWSRWLADHDSCMVCISKVVSLRRYPESLLPLTPYELQEKSSSARISGIVERDVNPTLALQSELVVVEQASERCVRSILLVKDSLDQILDALQTVESHLFNITRPDPGHTVTVESLTSVLAVERSTVVEQLIAYDNIFTERGDWVAMDNEMSLLASAVQSFSGRFDTYVERDDGIDTADKAADAALVENAVEVFDVLVASNSLQAQWHRLKSILKRLGSESSLMLGLMRIFGMIHISHSGGESNDIPAFALRVMASAQSKFEGTDKRLNDTLLPEATFLLERLQSMFPTAGGTDDDDETDQNKTALAAV